MDGSHQDPSINLHKEYMRSDNIAALFTKHGVPRPAFDLLSVDIDLNTFWVLRAILAAGYRPRAVVAEYNRWLLRLLWLMGCFSDYGLLESGNEGAWKELGSCPRPPPSTPNPLHPKTLHPKAPQPPKPPPPPPPTRNFAPNQSYSTMDLPAEAWDSTGKMCYYGASALAYERLMRAFDYSLVAFGGFGGVLVRPGGLSRDAQLHRLCCVRQPPPPICLRHAPQPHPTPTPKAANHPNHHHPPQQTTPGSTSSSSPTRNSTARPSPTPSPTSPRSPLWKPGSPSTTTASSKPGCRSVRRQDWPRRTDGCSTRDPWCWRTGRGRRSGGSRGACFTRWRWGLGWGCRGRTTGAGGAAGGGGWMVAVGAGRRLR